MISHHIYRAGVDGGRYVTKKDSVSECVSQVLDGGVRPSDSVISGQNLESTQPIGALFPQLAHGDALKLITFYHNNILRICV